MKKEMFAMPEGYTSVIKSVINHAKLIELEDVVSPTETNDNNRYASAKSNLGSFYHVHMSTYTDKY